MTTSKPSGLTFVELLIALAIFAILSVMGVRALESVTRTSGHLDLRHQQLQDLTILLRLMEEDFRDNDQRGLRFRSQTATTNNEWQLLGTGVTYSLRKDGQITRLSGQAQSANAEPITFSTLIHRIDIRMAQAGAWRGLEQIESRFALQAVQIELHLAKKGSVIKTIMLSGMGL